MYEKKTAYRKMGFIRYIGLNTSITLTAAVEMTPLRLYGLRDSCILVEIFVTEVGEKSPLNVIIFKEKRNSLIKWN